MSMAQREVCGNHYDKADSIPHTYTAPTLTVALSR